MKRLLTLLFTLGIAAFAADISGSWSADVPGRQGTQPTTFNFKVDGNKLTGTVTNARGETPIVDGKIDGDKISFSQKLEFGGNSMTIMYKGMVSGSEIKFTREREGGQPQEFVAKRKVS